MSKTIDATLLKQMYISGADNLYNHYPEIDRLNVFPVPDGDTGMNMNLTLASGRKAIQNRNDDSVGDLSAAFSTGLLYGARGNSGVITSQIFRGFAEALKGKKTIDVKGLSEAFTNGSKVAYKAVMKPVEGTILTVIRESAEALAKKAASVKSVETAMNILLKAAREALAKTPDLLPVLKEVGVVDSGGTGLVRIFEGMNSAVRGVMVERIENVEAPAPRDFPTLPGETRPAPAYAGAKLIESPEEAYGYCTQFILRLMEEDREKRPFDEDKFRRFLNKYGKSVVLVRDGVNVRVHVHTLRPGAMLNFAQNYGEFVTLSIENMSEEHHNIEEGRNATDMAGNIDSFAKKAERPEEVPHSRYAVIAVSSGAGLDEIFRELGAKKIVSGGQTMNPSTQDFVEAIKQANADCCILLPNNGNIILAANQAKEVLKDECLVEVIPSKTIPEGISALLQFSDAAEEEENIAGMTSALASVSSGSVTYAIKDTEIGGVSVKKDDYLAMKGKDIVCSLPSRVDALYALVASLAEEGGAILTIYAGKDVDEKEAEEIEKKLSAQYPDLEVEVRSGGQPVYSYLVGLE